MTARSFSSSALSSLVAALITPPVTVAAAAHAARTLPVPSFVAAAGKVTVSAPCDIISASWDASRGRVVLSTSHGEVWLVVKYASVARGMTLNGEAVARYLNRLAGRTVRLHTALGYTAFPANGTGYFAAISE